MESVARLPSPLNEFLGGGGTILTGNQRAARTLRLEFDHARRSDGISTWCPPKIFAWDTWLSSLWHQILLDGHSELLLLNRSQELQLWQSVVSSDSSTRSLQSIESLAAMAAHAWQQLCMHLGQSRLNSLGVSADTRAFQRWAQAFSRRLQTGLFFTQAELESATASVVSANGFRPGPEAFLLVGFDTFTPAQKALLDALSEADCSFAQQALAPIAPTRYLAATEDLNDELVQAALWLRERVEANPDSRIAVIHPDVTMERGEVDRVFRQHLAPRLEDITADYRSSPYEFSLGHPLPQQPMIALALDLLLWTMSPLPIEKISQLLLSPYFAGHPSERHPVAEFDAYKLRRTRVLRPELDLATVITQAERSHNAGHLAGLLRQLRGVHNAAATLASGNRQNSFADWADRIRVFLEACAWAASAPNTSIEFQTRRKWESVLDELATLDFEGAPCTFAQALRSLGQIAQRTLFAPESRDAPVQIMSPLEAAGSTFDAIYFLRASDLAWPKRPGMDPLLGWRLQRDLEMPGSNAAQDAEDAQRITARIAASATLVIFSYAKETAETHQRPSPCLNSLSLSPLTGSQAATTHPVVELEDFEDSAGILLQTSKIQGGSSVLKLQAACGFRAFAEKRLFSTAPESRDSGLDDRERGEIVHTALQQLWDELRTQANLRRLTSGERSSALFRAIDSSLAKFQSAVSSTWDAAYLALQRERLHRLLSAWLEVELRRPPFEVELREQEYEDVVIGPLLLSLRIDRVDRVFNEAGESLGELILDYKTGAAGPADWQSERPNEPQLPLYAALHKPGNVASIAFANVRAGTKMGLSGYAAGAGILPRPARLTFESLDDQIADWHRILTNLAIDFAEGDARVRPKCYPTTCQFCWQRILCRVDPAALADVNEEVEEPDV